MRVYLWYMNRSKLFSWVKREVNFGNEKKQERKEKWCDQREEREKIISTISLPKNICCPNFGPCSIAQLTDTDQNIRREEWEKKVELWQSHCWNRRRKEREKIELWQLKCQNRRRGERKKLNCDNFIAKIGRERREKKIELWQSHCRNSKRERKTNWFESISLSK